MRKIIFSALILIITLALCLVGAEELLRMTGLSAPLVSYINDGPVMFSPEPVLGWMAKPGMFTLPPFSPEGHETHYKFLEDGSRVTSYDEEIDSYDMIFVGCSFTEGFAVSDEDTFEWKLQSDFPGFKIGNFGTGGYSTYQSLLLLRKLYSHNIKPKYVVYDFMPFHEERNIAHSQWLRTLYVYSSIGHTSLPYCDLDNNNLVEHRAALYHKLPLQEYSSVIDFVDKFYSKFIDSEEVKRRKDGFEITKKLIVEMDQLAKNNGSHFYVAMLGNLKEMGPYPEKYVDFFSSSGISTIDFRIELGDDYIIRGDGHPNEKAHSVWEKRIKAFFEDQPVFRSEHELAAKRRGKTPKLSNHT